LITSKEVGRSSQRQINVGVRSSGFEDVARIAMNSPTAAHLPTAARAFGTSVTALAAENEMLRQAAVEILLQTLELRQKEQARRERAIAQERSRPSM